MATLDSVKAKIQGLITKANGKTGRSDTNMTAAVDALIAGFGQGGITPTGSLTITENGTYDVTEKAQAVVNVPQSGGNSICETVILDLSSQIGGTSATTTTLVSANEFVKKHYSHNELVVTLFPLQTSTVVGSVGILVQANRDISGSTSTNATTYGVRGYLSAAETFGFSGISGKLSGTSYNHSIRVDSAGNIKMYLPANAYLPVGKYLLVMACACE